MITVKDSCMFLHTNNTTYSFGVMPTGHLEHFYYGKRISGSDSTGLHTVDAGLREQNEFVCGNSIAYDKTHSGICLEDKALEFSGYGNGNINEPSIEMQYADGSITNDFVYVSYTIVKGKKKLQTLPSANGNKDNCEQLIITLKEKEHEVYVYLTYSVYEDTDIIVKSAIVENKMKESATLLRLMSNQLDFCEGKFVFHTFNGSWATEMHHNTTPLSGSRLVNSTYVGTSSNRANPFTMLATPQTSENFGDCYGLNLVYSGNHYTSVEQSSYGKVRLVSGINPQSFSWNLKPNSQFEAPEAVLTYSADGFNGMSKNMHKFVRQFIVRGTWQYKERPILLNSWEACYFNINEKKLLTLAKAGAKVGIELFVMDDGWFGHRDDDTSSLGDWDVNKKKLPGGIERLAQKVNNLGMDFGIWVEPEMVNEDSECYKKHTNWVIANPNRTQSLGRNQMILDLCNPEVQQYIIDEMTKVFSSGNISYVKWDMNRIISDSYSQYLNPEQQGEFFHRYYIGLYHVLNTLMSNFPDILFEGCASGGNRFDLGMLCYFPQIWGSDDTDAHERVQIQLGYSYGYPQNTVTAHVSSCPNHQTLRNTELESRFNVATFGNLGYEFNLSDLSATELDAIKEQVKTYKQWRKTLQFGQFYREKTDIMGTNLSCGDIDGTISWTIVDQNKKNAVGFTYRALTRPNNFFMCYKAMGLEPQTQYHFYNKEFKRNIKEFGSLINMASPVHIKEGSVAQSVAEKFVKLGGDKEDAILYGDRLMNAGYKTKQAFGGNGFNDKTRIYKDFASRLYFMEAIEEDCN